MYFIVDRFEGEFAVCEDQESGEQIDIAKSELSDDVHEGDVIFKSGEVFLTDSEKTKERKELIKRKFENLWK